MRSAFVVLALAAVVSAVFVTTGEGSNRTSTAGPIKIGLSQSLSGAIPLPAMTASYKQAIADTNKAGGVLVDGQRRKLQLVVYDNRTDVNLLARQMRKLVLQDKVSALLGSCCQNNVAAQALADSLKVPMVACCIPLELMKPDKGGYTWIAFQRLVDQAVGFFKLMKATPTNKKVAMVTNNDPSGPAAIGLWSGVGAKAGYDFQQKATVPTGTTDFSAFIDKAKSDGSDILVVQLVPPDCFALWKQMKALGYQPKVAVALQCGQAPGWSKGLGSIGNGTLAFQAWLKGAPLPMNNQIVAKFGRTWTDPAFLQEAAAGYQTALILIDAIKRAGSADPQKINAALAKTDGNYPLGHIRFNANHQAVTTSFLGQWSNGKLAQVYPAKGATKVETPVTGLG
jgi:branched-chain amino acid transport system substrate-binding protein